MYHYHINLYLSARDDGVLHVIPVMSTEPFSEDGLRVYVQNVMRSLQLTSVAFASVQSLDGTGEYSSVCHVSRLSESSQSSV